MPLDNHIQPNIIQITGSLRLRKYDGNYAITLKGYQDPYVYQNSEGIFDEALKLDLKYVEKMCTYLNKFERKHSEDFYYKIAAKSSCLCPRVRSFASLTVKLNPSLHPHEVRISLRSNFTAR